MREILFRGKDSITKSWVYGALVQQQDDPLKEKAFIISYSNYQFGDFSEAVMHEVDPETVGQCTGFGDKNGNKIFEGDIVCMDDWIPPCMQVAYAHPAVEEREQGCWKNGCCTVCGESAATDSHFDFIPEEEQKYCWNCGAIMDGETE